MNPRASEILFVSDNAKEIEVARKAGILVAVSIRYAIFLNYLAFFIHRIDRPGTAVLPALEESIPVVNSFAELDKHFVFGEKKASNGSDRSDASNR